MRNGRRRSPGTCINSLQSVQVIIHLRSDLTAGGNRADHKRGSGLDVSGGEHSGNRRFAIRVRLDEIALEGQSELGGVEILRRNSGEAHREKNQIRLNLKLFALFRELQRLVDIVPDARTPSLRART